MRILVIGADGTIGQALAAAFARRGDTVFATTRQPDRSSADRPLLDLASPAAAVLPNADVAVLCAAFTGYAACRNEPETAQRINGESTAALVRRFRAAGTRLVYLSTSAVFDGTQAQVAANTALNPVSEYGRSKAAGEAAIGSDGTIVRLSKVMADDFALLANWCAALRRGRPVDAFADMMMAPVTLDHAIAALLAIVTQGERGVFQVSATHDISYLDAARRLAQCVGVPSDLARSALAADHGIPPEERPQWSSMNAGRLAALTGIRPPGPYAAVEALVRAQRTDASEGVFTG